MFNVLVLLVMSVTVMLATYVLYNERQLNNVSKHVIWVISHVVILFALSVWYSLVLMASRVIFCWLRGWGTDRIHVLNGGFNRKKETPSRQKERCITSIETHLFSSFRYSKRREQPVNIFFWSHYEKWGEGLSRHIIFIAFISHIKSILGFRHCLFSQK